jgi:hypothetical protein
MKILPMLRNNAKILSKVVKAKKCQRKPILKNARMRKSTKKPAMQIRENAQRNATQSVSEHRF